MWLTAAAAGWAAVAGALAPAAAQVPGGLAVSVKAGTAGVGGEVAVPMSPRLALRGGLGWLPIEYHGTYAEQRYRIEPPGTYLTVGADLTLLGPLRLMGGFLRRSEPVRFDADLEGESRVGDQTYTAEGRLQGEVRSATTAPYLGLGLGRTVGSGLGVYLDLAVAFTGDPELDLDASGPITEAPGFQADLERERTRAQAELDAYYRYWPVISLGVRIGLGG
jgi:hypothetical protein